MGMVKSMTRLLLLLAVLALALCVLPAAAKEAELPPDFQLAIAITDPTASPPATALYALDPLTGERRGIYRDAADAAESILVRIAGSDVLHAARSAPPRDLYAMRGPAWVESPAACRDTLSRLRLGESTPSWEPLLLVPLCFSDASPYGLWNRAPIFAVSPDGRRVAFPALRVGEEQLPRLTIRVLSLAGGEERRIALPEQGWFTVNDLAWSPDGTQLAYAVLPEGDEHTLDESLLPKAGVYLADVDRELSIPLHPCYPEALDWSPVAGTITVAVRPRGIWDAANVLRVIDPAEGARREEISAQGFVRALAYSDDGAWLAVQSATPEGQRIFIYPAQEGFAREVFLLPASEGRLALLGWLRLPRTPS
jgi:hypothetical protein